MWRITLFIEIERDKYRKNKKIIKINYLFRDEISVTSILSQSNHAIIDRPIDVGQTADAPAAPAQTSGHSALGTQSNSQFQNYPYYIFKSR